MIYSCQEDYVIVANNSQASYQEILNTADIWDGSSQVLVDTPGWTMTAPTPGAIVTLVPFFPVMVEGKLLYHRTTYREVNGAWNSL